MVTEILLALVSDISSIIADNQYIDKSVVANISYDYYVEAIDIRGNSVSSNDVTVTPTSEDLVSPFADAGDDLFGIVGIPVSFDGLASSDNIAIASYYWDFGDGTSSVKSRDNHVFNAPGKYEVSLTVADAAGNSDTTIVEVTVYSNDHSAMTLVLRNNNYNYEIIPGNTVEIGFQLQGESLAFPDKISLCNKTVDATDCAEISFEVTNSWENGFIASVTISNITDEPLEAWRLKFNGNYEMVGLWNANRIYLDDNTVYVIENDISTTPIPVGESKVFSFQGAIDEGETPEFAAVSLTAITVDEGLCVQIMHYGPFDDEPATVALMDEYLQANGYVNDITDKRLHHEIYMSDARKVAPEKWKTVIRHPIRRL